MLPSSQPFTDTRAASALESPLYSAPGKVFVLGEYAILGGLPAVVASVGPRFGLNLRSGAASEFHPQSPAARLLDWADHAGALSNVGNALEFPFEFRDSFGGHGGFGASTAQFALAYRALAELHGWEQGWEKVWKLYRELTAGKGVFSPSGADLVAQWQGGVVLFEPAAEKPVCANLWRDFDWSDLLVFSAAAQEGRKVATHSHLDALSGNGGFERLLESLRPWLSQGINAIRENHAAGLGDAMNGYASALFEAGLELGATTLDRLALSRLPGVLGVKGAGALQADALLVLLDPDHRLSDREDVITEALSRGLELVSDGLEKEGGVA